MTGIHRPAGSSSLDGGFASPQPLNSSYITPQNCWTVNSSKARRGFVGARTLRTPWQESINQSPDQAAERSSADTLNLTAPDGSQSRWKNTQTSVFYPTMLGSVSAALSARLELKYEGDKQTEVDSMTGVAISAARRGLSHTQTLVCGTRQQTELLQWDSRIKGR